MSQNKTKMNFRTYLEHIESDRKKLRANGSGIFMDLNRDRTTQ